MAMRGLDEAFRGVGDKPGLDIWCILNLNLVPIPKSSHGKFFSGNAYLILHTNVLKTGVRQNYVHYWLGEDAKEVDCALASEKAIELDMALGSCTVQYREVQGSESEKFLSYFRPCIIPVEGCLSPQMIGGGPDSYTITMFSCRGDHVVHVREVPFSRHSLNHNEVFIIDTQSKIFLFSGCNSSTKSRAKALDVVQYIKENQHGGRCQVATIEDGKFVGDPDAGEFWSLFGGHAPISRDPPSETLEEPEPQSMKLFWVNKGKLLPVESATMDQAVLSSDKCYLLDCYAKLYLWMGKTVPSSEKKAAITLVEAYVHSEGRSTSTRTTFLNEGNETADFKSHFSNWPKNVSPTLYVEGKEKVAAIFKQKGFEVKELPDDQSELKEPLINCSGGLKVWLVDHHEKSLLPTEVKNRLCSGDCYVVEYNYVHNSKEYHLFYAWLGKGSTKEDRADAISITADMVDSVKGRAVMAQVYESEEPDFFFSVFKSLIVLKDGRSTAYKNLTEQKKQNASLFRIQGLGYESVQAIEVDLVPSSLNSSYCYILQEGDFFYTWIGSFSTPHDEDLLYQMLDKLSALKQSILVREDSELDDFWRILGKKSEYPKERHTRLGTEDPRLYTGSLEEDSYEGKEIYNFTQDDLTTEDALILDSHNEIFIWVGLCSNFKSKDQALLLGKKFLEAEVGHQRSIGIPIYVIGEGNEPPFFTCFFDWDPSKTNMYGNSFERKLALVKGSSNKTETNEKDAVTRKQFQSEATKLQETNSVIYPYEILKVHANTPITGIDVTRREAYMSAEEFQDKFRMTKDQFYKLPKWRQNKLKSDLDLF
ncbi:Villin-like 1 [Rhynchospora pubera]|uniref:Villin-like 1 n=1 Tax=Rhynchospora pubera TaxID=906938 RepID=A0AAV8EMM1_9POAL|nr:Villin-like 1 [Rhynchospora pubera]